MPETGYTHIQPGTALTAASIGNRLANMRTAVNAVPASSIEPHSLTRQHLPSMIQGTPKQALLPIAIGSEHIYSSQAAAEPYPGWDTVTGWKVINDGGTTVGANLLQVSGLGVTLSSNVSIEVKCGIEVVDVEVWDYSGGGAGARLGAVFANATRVWAAFAIQYSNDGATWFHIASSEKYMGSQTANMAADAQADGGPTVAHQNRRQAMSLLIRSTHDGGAIEVNYVRMVVSCHRGAFGGTDHCRVRLRNGQLSAIGLRHGTLS